jgi:hypothetical protein
MTAIIIGAVLGTLFVIVLITVLFWLQKRRQRRVIEKPKSVIAQDSDSSGEVLSPDHTELSGQSQSLPELSPDWRRINEVDASIEIGSSSKPTELADSSVFELSTEPIELEASIKTLGGSRPMENNSPGIRYDGKSERPPSYRPPTN